VDAPHLLALRPGYGGNAGLRDVLVGLQIEEMVVVRNNKISLALPPALQNPIVVGIGGDNL